MNKIKRQGFSVLPSQVIEDVKKLDLSSIKTNQAYLMIHRIVFKASNYRGGLFEPVEMSANYFRKAIGSHYLVVLNKLVNSGIIDRDDSYSVDKGKCKTYSVGTKYVDNITSMETVSLTEKVEKEDNLQDIYAEWFKDDVKSLDIDFSRLREITVSKTDSLTIEDFTTNNDIDENSMEITLKMGGKSRVSYWTKDKALTFAEENNLTLVKHKSRFYLQKEEDFLKERKASIKFSYLQSISLMEKGYWKATRNSTNNRLDTNFTNLCKELLEIIIEDNNLVEVDLRNSQLAILGHLLYTEGIDTTDAKKFQELASNGGIYEYMQNELGLGCRKDAKLLMFEILFSHQNNSSTGIEKFRSHFPTVYEYVYNFKEKEGYKNFSVALQQMESDMFINELLPEIKKMGIVCISKHDALIVREEDKDKVTEVMQEYFNSIGFLATF